VANFSVLTAHGTALAQLATNPKARAGDVADTLGITERAAQRLIADLVEAGFVERVQNGRRTAYVVAQELPISFAPGRDWNSLAPAADGATRSSRDEVRDRLLAAAEQLMTEERSFLELTVDELTAQAKMSSATFYANFQDSEALLQAVLPRIFDEISAAAAGWLTLDAGFTRADLGDRMAALVRVFAAHRLVLSAASGARAGRTGVQTDYAGLMSRVIEQIEVHIRKGQADGFVRRQLDPHATATLLAWGAERRLSHERALRSKAAEDRVAASLSDVLWELMYDIDS
jgi:AcrR family transcriptional regulator